MTTIRPLRPEDRDLLAEGFERLSPESRYRRFFAQVPRLTERQLDYLTQIDQHDHVALAAVDDANGRIVGVARYVRTGDGVAEPAIVVADDHQGQGIAGALLGRLVERALEEGVTTFVAPVLADNPGAIHVLQSLGETDIERHGHEVELTIRLSSAEPEPARGARDVLRAVAAGALEPALVLWHRSLPRRGVPRQDLRNVIVAGLEDGDGATVALATDLARAWGAQLVLAAARNPLADDQHAAEAAVERAAATPRGAGVDVRVAVRPGDLGAILLDEAAAERARLIVVADPGGDATVTGRLLGSAWDHVSHHARCDVLIARERPALNQP